MKHQNKIKTIKFGDKINIFIHLLIYKLATSTETKFN